jgi:hypothetical protein
VRPLRGVPIRSRINSHSLATSSPSDPQLQTRELKEQGISTHAVPVVPFQPSRDLMKRGASLSVREFHEHG